MDDEKDARSTSADAVQATGNGGEVPADPAEVTGVTTLSSGASSESSGRVPLPPTASELLATELLGVLNDFAARIPGLSSPHKSTAGRVRGQRTISKAFMRSAIFTTEQFDYLQATGTLGIDAARETLQFVDAFKPVLDKLKTLTQDLGFTIELKTADVADAALRIYGVARILSRDPAAAELGGHAAILKKHLGRKGGRKKKAPQDGTPG
jgi:hypothetical protein